MAVKQIYFNDDEMELIEYADMVRGSKPLSAYLKSLIRKEKESAGKTDDADRLKALENEVARLATLLETAIRPQFMTYAQPVVAPVVEEKKPKLDNKQMKAMASIMAISKK